MATVANHIANFLHTPDIMFVQEIQDNSGPTDDGTVDASQTLSALSASVKSQGGVAYSCTEVLPVNDQDGGEPGGNIRPAYLFNSATVSLVAGIPVTKHEVQSFDCHPIPGSPTAPPSIVRPATSGGR